MTRPRIFVVLGVLGLFGVAAGTYLLLSPGNPVTRAVGGRPEDAHVEGRTVIIGPYPVDADFVLLASQGVKTIVSLLDPALPYEAILLEREKENAARHGMTVYDYPMTSIFGRKLHEDVYAANARAAAARVAETVGPVYVHCYLGRHRAQVVRALIGAQERVIEHERTSERSALQDRLDRAEVAYRAGAFREVLALLDEGRDEGDRRASSLLGWAAYRLEDLPRAKAAFTRATSGGGPDDARTGLGFVALREDDLESADRAFASVLAHTSTDAAALFGAGLVAHRRGDRATAKRHLERALELDPANAEARTIFERLR